jgi:S-disulfanyl-L-cysteine oxidoreductase SoxD
MVKHSLLVPVVIAGFVSLAGGRAVGPAAAQSTRAGRQPFPTVWSGVYSNTEAERGKQVYAQLCSRCHGTDMKGGLTAPGLIGAKFFDRWHDLRLADVVAYIQAGMPKEHEFYVPADSARMLVAQMLRESGVPPGQKPMSTDVKSQHDILITRPRLVK